MERSGRRSEEENTPETLTYVEEDWEESSSDEESEENGESEEEIFEYSDGPGAVAEPILDEADTGDLPEKFLLKYRFRGKTIKALWAEADKTVMTNQEKDDLYEFIRNARDLRSLQVRLYAMIMANKQEREDVRQHLRQKKMKNRLDWLKYDISRGLVPVGEDSPLALQALTWAAAWFYPAPGEQGVYRGALVAQRGERFPFGLDAEDNVYQLEIGFPSDFVLCSKFQGPEIWRTPVGKVSNSKYNLPSFNSERRETLLFAHQPAAGAGGEEALLLGPGGEVLLRVPSQDRSDAEGFYPRWFHCGGFLAALSRGGLEVEEEAESGTSEAVLAKMKENSAFYLNLVYRGNIIASEEVEEGALLQPFESTLVVAEREGSRIFRLSAGGDAVQIQTLEHPYLAAADKGWLIAEKGILYSETHPEGRKRGELKKIVSVGRDKMILCEEGAGPFGGNLKVADRPK